MYDFTYVKYLILCHLGSLATGYVQPTERLVAPHLQNPKQITTSQKKYGVFFWVLPKADLEKGLECK